MSMSTPSIVVTCFACGQRVPLRNDAFEMREHGMFEVGPDEGNVICPGSNTGQYKFDTNERSLFGDDLQAGEVGA